MKYTKNYKLNLPEGFDEIDVGKLNANFENIERQLAELWFWLQVGSITVNMCYSADESSYNARLCETMPSFVHDRWAMAAKISVWAEIFVNNDQTYMTINESDSRIDVFGFSEVSDKDRYFSGRECPIWLEINLLDKSVRIEADCLNWKDEDVYAEGDIIYIKIGLFSFDWDPDEGVVYEHWDFAGRTSGEATVDFSSMKGV